MNPANETPRACPDCQDGGLPFQDRREFLRSVSLASLAAAAGGGITAFAVPRAHAAPSPKSAAETAVKALYDKLTDEQKKTICFDWDHKAPRGGYLRNFVSNNWHITQPAIDSSFFTREQKGIIRDIYKGIFNPDWVEKFDKQLKDDTGGRAWGADQNIALFGTPGDGKFMFVMTGRHMTVRADGNSEGHVALGGPIFHGHAASGFNEKPGHPGNIFWHQAVLANKLFGILDGKQQKLALDVGERIAPDAFETVRHKGPTGKFAGLPCSELSKDQNDHLHKVLQSLIEPYRKEDREEIEACLKAQGGLQSCFLTFYKAEDIGDDGEWDNWRLDGPAFGWYFRGSPHVHIWINVAADPTAIPRNVK